MVAVEDETGHRATEPRQGQRVLEHPGLHGCPTRAVRQFRRSIRKGFDQLDADHAMALLPRNEESSSADNASIPATVLRGTKPPSGRAAVQSGQCDHLRV